MKRLIDLDEALRGLDGMVPAEAKSEYQQGIASGIALAKVRIVSMPSAQRKGKWIYLNGLDAFECSVCGRQMVRNIFDYCPWCGAEMTKGEEDE